MNKSTSSTPRDVFLYLLVTITLYVVAVSSITLLFQYVNYFFPDPVGWYGNRTELLRTFLSILVIFTPVYVWATRFLNSDMLENKEKHGLGIRRWLVHLTLFASGVTIMVDLATLIYNFLGGELTARFLLKIVAVLLVAAGVFMYYIWDLRREAQPMPVKMLWLARGVLVALAGFVIGGFFLMDSPAEQRKMKLDDQRTADLWTIQAAVENHWWEQQALPETLEELNPGLLIPVDPATGSAYEYTRTGAGTYEVCATFTNATKDQSAQQRTAPYIDAPYQRDFYLHDAGRDCFERSVKQLK